MKKMERSLVSGSVLLFVLCFLFNSSLVASYELPEKQLADVSVGAYGVQFFPKMGYDRLVLTVGLPNGTVMTKTFEGNGAPFFNLSDIPSNQCTDGLYTFELRAMSKANKLRLPKEESEAGLRERINPDMRVPVQSGYFVVVGNGILPQGLTETSLRVQDVLHYDDVIITGSLCVGWDCANGESFGYDTVKLKENNLRLFFEDTSAGSFPSGDWRIRINDTTSGGASYFAVEDALNGRTPFRIETGAPTHALYVEDYGRVGLGTSIPYVELHIVDGDSPTVRLDQDGSSGWVAQRWDLCGNETNFFIRDVTNGSKLCLRIQPNTPSSTLCMRSTGYVGIGTWSPAYKLEVETTGENSAVVVERTDGVTNFMNATDTYGNFGTVSNHSVQILTNSSWRMRLNTNNTLEMRDGGDYDGTWNPASSRQLKENIQNLTLSEARDALTRLNPVKYNYKKDKEEPRVGFIAEDVPELVAMNGRKKLGTVDIIATLTKVVQEQQKTIAELKKRITKLEKK